MSKYHRIHTKCRPELDLISPHPCLTLSLSLSLFLSLSLSLFLSLSFSACMRRAIYSLSPGLPLPSLFNPLPPPPLTYSLSPGRPLSIHCHVPSLFTSPALAIHPHALARAHMRTQTDARSPARTQTHRDAHRTAHSPPPRPTHPHTRTRTRARARARA